MAKNKESETSTKPSGKKFALTWRRVLIIVVFIALAGGCGYVSVRYVQARNDIKRLSNPAEAAKQESKDLVTQVGKLVDLPTTQEPTIATVQDITKLQGQPFFKSAQNGDKVLIYTQAKKAILYRPSTNKVIVVAPINLGTDQPATDQPAQ